MSRGGHARLAAWALALLGVGLHAQSARAFSDPVSFADGVELGGGGGRYFTASAADGFGCDVCHAGGPRAQVRILGLPLSGYVPGVSYEVQVQWPNAVEHVGLALELTDRSGVPAGSLRLPPDSELANEERCEPVEDGISASTLTEVEGGRVILNVIDCGAQRTRFLWTAPATARGSLRLSGGLVAADGEADALGDGSTVFARALTPASRNESLASDIHGTCSATPTGNKSHTHNTQALSLCASLLYLRARKRRTCRLRPRSGATAHGPPVISNA